MCGITGFVARASAPDWASALRPAADALHHRGPDDTGIWLSDDSRVGLGHKRLSILDLSAHGHQPMRSACDRFAMVFNGEVYNFREIRGELEALGHSFHGTGDSEVILAGFAQWGPEAVQRFIGMFAIALWSFDERRLYLFRDRLGVKPLYWGWFDKGTLAFASELKALRAFPGWTPAIDRDALVDYLRYGYIIDPRSIYQGVSKLPPGHWLVLDEHGEPQLHRYWNVSEPAHRPAGSSEEALADELETLLESAFSYRMIADVPVGVFLSGGIDSSVLAAILQKHAAKAGGPPIKTFTIGFDEAEKNEAPFAEAVARHLGTEQHTRILKVEQAMQILPTWGDLYDEPFGDSSGVPTLLVSQVAAEQVKVVLSADGGDELFSGYVTYTSITAQARKLAKVPAWLRGLSSVLLGLFPWQALDDWLAEQHWSWGLRSRITVRFAKIRERLGLKGIGEVFDRALGESYWPDRDLRRLLGTAPATRPNADSFPGNDGEKMCLWDLHNYLPGDVLTKVDRATMRASIEGREPLLDHRLAEFAFALPYAMRQGALGPKHLLRKVLYRHVPRALIDRPKQGFGIPLQQWLRGGMRPLVDRYLSPERIRAQGLFDAATVASMVRRLDAGDLYAVNRVWLLLAFQMWHERWMTS